MQNLKVLKYVGDEKKAEWGKYWIELGFNGNWCTVICMYNITTPYCPCLQLWRSYLRRQQANTVLVMR